MLFKINRSISVIAIISAIFTVTSLPLPIFAADTKLSECAMISDAVTQSNYKVNNLDDPSQMLLFLKSLSEKSKNLPLTNTQIQIFRDVIVLELKDRIDLWQNVSSIVAKGDPKEIEILKIRVDLKRKNGRILTEMFNEYCFSG